MRITLGNRVFYSNNIFDYIQTMDQCRENNTFVYFYIKYRIRFLYQKSVSVPSINPLNRLLSNAVYKKISLRSNFVYQQVDAKVFGNTIYL